MATKSQNGWPASANQSELDLVTISIPLRYGTKSVTVARKAADAFEEIITWWDEHVEPVTSIYGYNYREIRGYEGTGTISNHGSGTAVDINASQHPPGAEGTVSPAMRAYITAKAASLGLRWGGDYSNRKDEMHFEVILPPTADMFRKGALTAGKYWLIWLGTGGAVVGGLGFLLWLKKRKKAHHVLTG